MRREVLGLDLTSPAQLRRVVIGGQFGGGDHPGTVELQTEHWLDQPSTRYEIG